MLRFLTRSYKWLFAAVAVLASAYMAFVRTPASGLAESLPTALYSTNMGDEDSRIRFKGGDIENLKILYRVIYLVQQRYLDASRIDPKRMLHEGLKELQRFIPEFIVKEERGDRVQLQINQDRQQFKVSDVSSLSKMLSEFNDMFRFLKARLKDKEVDLNEAQYKAINGMLSTLDPHSVLIDPKLYREMMLKTKGEFGGLGIVISIRDGQLTIISPMDGTPAAKVGLRQMDRIVKIGDISTVNMPLDEAVSLLRGPPGTPVSIWVTRKAWTEPKRFDLVRAIIHIESVESVMLPGRIGYVLIKEFQANTAQDLASHLAKLHGEGMAGLILDLRNNPGGLLDAAVDVADLFVRTGPIVTTAGRNPSERDVREARPEGTEPFYPMACLVDGGSASASEIVSGALQATRRCLVVGEPTFGKGSVQMLWNFDDGSALKLTIGQYLTPGDVSIQSVGVQPDIQTRAVVVDKDDIDLEKDLQVKESDLSEHLESAKSKHDLRQHEEVAYLYREKEKAATPDSQQDAAPKEGEAADEAPPEDDLKLSAEKVKTDFDVQIASRILEKSRGAREMPGLPHLKTLLEDMRKSEVARMAAALGKLGVDWSSGKDDGPAKLEAKLVMKDATVAEAGGTCILKAEISNLGPGAAYRLRATSRSDNPLFQDREFVFGRLGPGETRSFEVPIKMPVGVLSRADDVSLVFSEEYGRIPRAASTRIAIQGKGRPRFSTAYFLVDRPDGNGDGLIQKGEVIRLALHVCNIGRSPSLATQALITTSSNEAVFIRQGRADLGKLAPGQCNNALFSFEARTGEDAPELPLEIEILDPELNYMIQRPIPLRVSPEGPATPAAQGTVAASEGASLYDRPAPDAETLGTASKGATFRVLGKAAGFWLVALDAAGDTSAFLKASAASPTGQAPNPVWAWSAGHTPPWFDLESPVPLAVKTPELLVNGAARDDEEIRDVTVFVGDSQTMDPRRVYNQKVLYASHVDGGDPKTVLFSAKVPLGLGSNILTIVARHSGKEETREFFVIRRDGGNGQAYLAPTLGNGDPEPIAQYAPPELPAVR